jgi:hypothetical protein
VQQQQQQRRRRQAAAGDQPPDRLPLGLYSRQQYARQLYGGQQEGVFDSDDEDALYDTLYGAWIDHVSDDLGGFILELQDLWMERDDPRAAGQPGSQQQRQQRRQQQQLLSFRELQAFRPSQAQTFEGLADEALMDWVEFLFVTATAERDVEKRTSQ